MSEPELCVVIMAGGAGTRFWPVSTRRRPKQFLRLLGERSLLQQSHERALLLAPPERILVLTNEDFVPLVREQLPDLPAENIVGEPMRRDTAAALAFGALLCKKRFGDVVMVVLTADHLIEPPEAFARAMRSAGGAAAREPVLYTFGVKPIYAATAYGYLHQGEELLADGDIVHYSLRGFREKPDLQTAEEYLQSGEFWWNSGMFVWAVDTILGELGQFLPGHLALLGPAAGAWGTAEGPGSLRDAFAALPAVSIDYAVMERSELVRMVAAPFAWSDLGGWLALEEFLEADDRGNRGEVILMALDSEDNLVFTEDPTELVALVGVRNLVVVRAGHRTLIVERSRAEEIKNLVRELEQAGRDEYL